MQIMTVCRCCCTCAAAETAATPAAVSTIAAGAAVAVGAAVAAPSVTVAGAVAAAPSATVAGAVAAVPEDGGRGDAADVAASWAVAAEKADGAVGSAAVDTFHNRATNNKGYLTDIPLLNPNLLLFSDVIISAAALSRSACPPFCGFHGWPHPNSCNPQHPGQPPFWHIHYTHGSFAPHLKNPPPPDH